MVKEECSDCINSINLFDSVKCIFFVWITVKNYNLVKADIMANIYFKPCNFFAPLKKVKE